MVIGMVRATLQLRSEETVQIKLATAQTVKAKTDKPSGLGQVGRISFLTTKAKRQTRTARPNRMTIPFVAYSATIGVNRPTRLNAKEIGD